MERFSRRLAAREYAFHTLDFRPDAPSSTDKADVRTRDESQLHPAGLLSLPPLEVLESATPHDSTNGRFHV